MPPDEDEDEPYTGPDKPTDMEWDDKGHLTGDGHGNSIKYGSDQHGLYVDGPGEGDDTYLRHEIRSENGDYALRFEDGNLVVKHVDSGRTLWNSETKGESWSGDISGLKVGPNGELLLTYRPDNLPSAVPSSTYKLTEGLKGIEGATLILNDDGSLVIVDKNGEVRAKISPPDDKKNRPLHLYRPENISKGLREFIGKCERVILKGYYLLGAGTPQAMPDFSSLLSNAGLKDVDNVSNASEYYNKNVGAVARLKEEMITTSAKVSVAAKDMSSEGLATKNFIIAEVDALNTKLHAVDDYDSIHPKEDEEDGKKTKKKYEYDFPLEWNKEAGELWIKPGKEDRIFGWLDDTTDKIIDRIRKTSDWAERTGGGVPEDKTPKPKNTHDPKNPPPPDQTPPNQVPPGTDPSLQQPPNGTQPTNTDFSDTFKDLPGVSGSKDPSGSSAKGASGIEELLAPIREALTNKSAAGAPAAGLAAGAPAAGAPGAGGNLLSSLMLPMMLLPMITQMMEKRKEEEERDKEEREREEEEGSEETGPVAPGPGATAPTPAPTPGPAPGTEPGVTAPSPESTPPAITQKSMVDMKLPNGTSQRVSSVVAEAVNRELNNPNGSDARAAYQGTAGEATAGSPWMSVESSAVKTGDIAQWDNRSGLVIVTDSGLQTIVNGQMVPLDPHNPPDGGQGGYGNFRGFFHPSGADVTDASQMATVGAPPPVSTGQPSVPPTPPAVTPQPSVELR